RSHEDAELRRQRHWLDRTAKDVRIRRPREHIHGPATQGGVLERLHQRLPDQDRNALSEWPQLSKRGEHRARRAYALPTSAWSISPPAARWKRFATSPSTFGAASSWRSSVPAVAASPPCCASSPGYGRRPPARSVSMACRCSSRSATSAWCSRRPCCSS